MWLSYDTSIILSLVFSGTHCRVYHTHGCCFAERRIFLPSLTFSLFLDFKVTTGQVCHCRHVLQSLLSTHSKLWSSLTSLLANPSVAVPVFLIKLYPATKVTVKINRNLNINFKKMENKKFKFNSKTNSKKTELSSSA